MKVFLYEHLCALADGELPASLQVEGRAMLQAVREDFGRLRGVTCVHLEGSCTVPSASLSADDAHRNAFLRLAAEADFTLVIAPEFDDILLKHCRWVEEAGGRLLGPNPEAVALTADKLALSQHLACQGIATPPCRVYREDQPALEYPCVVKPRFGAGSQDTMLLSGPGDSRPVGMPCEALVQPYVASVDDHGERSLVWIDGAFTHQIRKAPRFAGDAESVTGPYPIGDDERAVAAAAIAPWADRILYGRVDLARDDRGAPMVMELELAEPSLFFRFGEGAVERYVAGLTRRLAR